MYNVSKGPTSSRIINRTRTRDLSQNFDHRELSRKNSEPEDVDQQEQCPQPPYSHHHSQKEQEPTMTSPRPVFQTVNNKGNRSTNGRGHTHEPISPQHEELIRFFNESWGRVLKEVEMSRQGGHDTRGNGIAYYQDKHVHPALQDFKPFDLEAWWGKRLYQNLTQST